MKTISCTSQGVEISILNNDKHHKALKIGEYVMCVCYFRTRDNLEMLTTHFLLLIEIY